MCFIEDAATQVILVFRQTILRDDKIEKTLENYVILYNWAPINLRKDLFLSKRRSVPFSSSLHFTLLQVFVFSI